MYINFEDKAEATQEKHYSSINEYAKTCEIIIDTSSIVDDAGFCMLRYFTQSNCDVCLPQQVLKELNNMAQGNDLLGHRAIGTLNYLNSSKTACFKIVKNAGINGDESIVQYLHTEFARPYGSKRKLVVTNGKGLALRVLNMHRDPNCAIFVKKPIPKGEDNFALINTLETVRTGIEQKKVQFTGFGINIG